MGRGVELQAAFLGMLSSACMPSLLLAAMVLIAAPLLAHGEDNDGHPLCNGGKSKIPTGLLCWSTADGEKGYKCMWYTMEVLSGWPVEPRAPGLTCDDLQIDCESSYICSVLLQYAGVGPMESFGEDPDRGIAADCLRKQCPAQAALADPVIAGVAGAECPHSRFHAKNVSRDDGADDDSEAEARREGLKLARVQELGEEANELGEHANPATAAIGTPVADRGAFIFGSWRNESDSDNTSNETDMNISAWAGDEDPGMVPTFAVGVIALVALVCCACPAAMAKGRRQTAAREMLLPPPVAKTGEGERAAVLEAAVDDAE